jgi:chromosome segregation ATPase
MSKDLTQRLDGSLEDKVDRLIAAVQSIGSQVQSIDARVQSLDSLLEARLGRLETRLDSLETRLDSLETRLDSLEIKVDERLKETRPMWEAVQAQLAELGESQGKGFHRFDRVMDRLSGDMNRLHGEQVELDSRVDKIEKRLSQ